MHQDSSANALALTQAVKAEAHRLGFQLAGVTTPEPPPHFAVFENWLAEGRHGEMLYLAGERSRERRSDPRHILPECQSILVLGMRYPAPLSDQVRQGCSTGRIASYALGRDYHDVLPQRLKALVLYMEAQVGQEIPNRWYTDTGPVLERDLAQRAGLGWIGKNTCLINPAQGSYFFLAEIFLGIELTFDQPFRLDHCGTCARCLEACPTGCILPDRTLDARRCISYLTIELKGSIPPGMRPGLAIGSSAVRCASRFARGINVLPPRNLIRLLQRGPACSSPICGRLCRLLLRLLTASSKALLSNGLSGAGFCAMQP